jgi:ankyrin repeat protein
MELLLDKHFYHVEINSKGGPEHFTALAAAANSGQLDAVSLLIKHGADINEQNDKVRTPLM